MTHADTPFLAVQGVINDPVNPFTGNKISMEEKTAHDQFIMTTSDWQVNRRATVFAPSRWAVVSENMHDRRCWKFIDNEIVLKEHKIP